MWRQGSTASVIATASLALMLVGSCSTEGDERAPASSAPAASSPADDVQTLASADCPDLACEGPLEPGRYLADYFDPTIGFEIATPGWQWMFSGGTFGLRADDFHNGLLYSSDGIYFLRDPAIAAQDCEEAPEPGVGRSANELAAWLEAAPGLAASGSTPVSVGGLDGVRIDLRLDPGWERTCPFTEPLPAVPLVFRGADVGGYHWVLVPDQRMRWYILDTGDGVIVVDIEDAPAGAPRDELLQTGDQIVHTLAFSQP